MDLKNNNTDGLITLQVIKITVNGEDYELILGRDVAPWDTLSHTLRETLNLTGTKKGCGHGACGACTVLVDGGPVLSCLMLTVDCDGKKITTIEGLADPVTGELDLIQKSFAERTAFQCGFCTPGIILSLKALLNEKSSVTEDDVKEMLSGHYCRCISHYHVLDAVKKILDEG